MADGGQRLLDVIDDPNALESFLGGLTSDPELLPSAETVDNVVASLARSLDDAEYEPDSPNDTFFDTLDSSSSHLTDISRSYVPSDFGNVVPCHDSFPNNLEGFSNGNNNVIGNRGNNNLSNEQIHVQTSSDQFIGSTSNNNNNNNTSSIINSVISAPSLNSTVVSSNNLKQIVSSVSNCDPSKSNFVHSSGQQFQIQNSVSSSSHLNFFSQHDLQQQQQLHKIEVSQNQLNQVTSLSSVSLEGQQLQHNSVPSSNNNSTNNLISAVVASGHNNNGAVGLSMTNATTPNSFQVAQQQQQSGQPKSNVITSGNQTSTSAGNNEASNANTANSSSQNITLSTSTNVVGSAGTNIASIQQPQFITNTSGHQQIVGQTVSIPSMTVSAPQLIANSQGGIVAASAAGQNILQQIQSAGASQNYIAMDQPTLIATGAAGFGTTNVALVATGGTPTYAVLPTTQQFLTNAIIPQHTIQTLTKTPNGTFFQAGGTPQIVATSSVANALQNVASAVTTSSNTVSTSPVVTSVSSSTEGSNVGTGGAQQTLPANSAADGVVTQILQQSQQQITNVSGNTGTVSLAPQQSFTIGNAAGLGQVVVSQVGSINTMTAPQQTQLTGTIVVNQYGQPMLLPTASTAQAGLQLILRQQPAQPQVLTIQAPTGQATAQAAGGKPIVRYVPQVPQLAQTQGYGLQQIQTPNGPTWVAVRYPQVSQANQFSQIQADSIISASSAIQNQIPTSGQSQIQIQTLQQQQSQQIIQQAQQQQQQQQQPQQIQLQSGLTQTNMSTQQLQIQGQQIQLQNQQVSNVQQQSQQNLQQQSLPQSPMESQSTPTSGQQSPFLNRPNHISQQVNHSPQTPASQEIEQQQISVPDSSSEPPPPKKAKSKPKNSKKKVTLDLEQLMKQTGIIDDDMSFDFGFGSMMDTTSNGFPPSPQVPPAQIPVINTTETPKKSSKKKSSSKKSPAQAPPPPPPVVIATPPVATPSPSAKKKKATPKRKAPPPAPTPPPPVQPPPPPIATPSPSKSKSKKKSNANNNINNSNSSNSGSVKENHKSETKTGSSKKSAPPKKVSSLDELLATINAVAAAGGAPSALGLSTPSPLPPPPPPVSLPSTPTPKPTPSPKPKSKSKPKSKKSTPKTENPVDLPVSNAAPLQLPNPPAVPSALPNSTHLSSQPLATQTPSSVSAPPSVSASTTALPRVPGGYLLNGNPPASPQPQPGLTRVVQTIQLTPANQQLLCNIQGQIKRLSAIPKRNETEQAALQKLFVLQQQVIATGTPVPNPTHLNNETIQGKGVPMMTAPTPGATVPVPSQNSLPFSQTLQHVPSIPPQSSYVPSSFSTRSVVDEKKAEEIRLQNQKAEEEKRARWKKEEFEMLLQRDQQYVVKPDYEVPFTSKKDAVERLSKYHIYRDRNDMDFEEFDEEFNNNAGILLEKFSVMMSKYRNLLLKESTKEVGCAERVMLERMFMGEEKLRLEQDRLLVAQGDAMELPPPPESWKPKIKEMVDKEMMEFEPQDPVLSQQVQSAVDSIIGCESNDTNTYLLEDGDKIEYDAFGVPINSSGYAGLTSASSADIDEAVRSILS